MNATNATNAVTKKVIAKIKAGDVVEVKFNDSPNELGLVLAKPDAKSAGEVDINLFLLDRHHIYNAVHTQVVAHFGVLNLKLIS